MKGERTMTKAEIAEGIKAAMIDTGRAGEKWRVEVTGCDRATRNSDYVRVYVSVYKPRSRKPDVLWDLCINDVKELIFWEHSHHYNAK
jgi:hypothetical protein